MKNSSLQQPCSLPEPWVRWPQFTAADAFTSAPQNIFPLLDRNTRLDMVDYVKSGLSTPRRTASVGAQP